MEGRIRLSMIVAETFGHADVLGRLKEAADRRVRGRR